MLFQTQDERESLKAMEHEMEMIFFEVDDERDCQTAAEKERQKMVAIFVFNIVVVAAMLLHHFYEESRRRNTHTPK